MFRLFDRASAVTKPAAQVFVTVTKEVTKLTLTGMAMHASGTVCATAEHSLRKRVNEFQAKRLTTDSAPSSSITLT